MGFAHTLAPHVRCLPTLPRFRAWALLAGAVLAGCGEPAATLSPGGRGTLSRTAAGVSVLVLEGTPRQMGWWQGHLLGDRIRGLHRRWRERLFAATVGAGSSDARAGIEALRDHIEAVVDLSAHQLRARHQDELQGMAEACGMPRLVLYELEVLRDALRWQKGMETRLPGAVGLDLRDPERLEARAIWTGPDAPLLAQEALIVIRKPADEARYDTAVLTWPGALGGVAGWRQDGACVLTSEVQVAGRRRSMGNGRASTIFVREALEGADNLFALETGVQGNVGHAVLVCMPHRANESHPQAIGTVSAYHMPKNGLSSEDMRVLLIGPYEDLPGPLSDPLIEVARNLPAGTSPWEALAKHAAGDASAPTGPHLVLEFSRSLSEQESLPGSVGLAFHK